MDPSPAQTTPETKTAGDGRRGFLRVLAGVLSAVAAVLVAVPFVGYVFGIRKRKVYWVDLGPASDFELNQTRLVTFDNPLEQPWDGVTAQNEVFVRYEGTSQGTRSVLGSECELCPLGLPGHLVSAVGAVFVSLPRRRLLRQRGPCVGSAAAGTVSLRVARAAAASCEVQAPHYPTLHDTLRQPA